jgi:hypothetical protein
MHYRDKWLRDYSDAAMQRARERQRQPPSGTETLERAGFTGRATYAAIRPYRPCLTCSNPIVGGEWDYCYPCTSQLYAPTLHSVLERELANRALLRAVDRWPADSETTVEVDGG